MGEWREPEGPAAPGGSAAALERKLAGPAPIGPKGMLSSSGTPRSSRNKRDQLAMGKRNRPGMERQARELGGREEKQRAEGRRKR